MSDNNNVAGSWQEYKNLVIKELERNDENIQKVLSGVQSISNEISSINTSINIIKEELHNNSEKNIFLENKISILEKDYVKLKTKILTIGAITGTILSLGITILIKLLL